MIDSGSIAISLRGVRKVYANDIDALECLEFDIRRGEFVSLLGPSGCGKSTALRIIAGLSPPTTGSIDLGGSATGRRRIGFVFQEPTLMPWATVRDNVFLPLRLTNSSRARARARVDEALAGVG